MPLAATWNQYTALDDCTRFLVLRLYPRLNGRTSLDVLAELQRVLPFPSSVCSVSTNLVRLSSASAGE